MPWEARRIPFSIISGTLPFEMSPLTPFTSGTCGRWRWRRASAQIGATGNGSLTFRPTGSVWTPHAQRSQTVFLPHPGHCRNPNDTTTPVDRVRRADSRRIGVAPPDSPSGKSAWTFGLILRWRAFSGRPTRPPIREGDRGGTATPASRETNAIGSGSMGSSSARRIAAEEATSSPRPPTRPALSFGSPRSSPFASRWKRNPSRINISRIKGSAGRTRSILLPSAGRLDEPGELGDLVRFEVVPEQKEPRVKGDPVEVAHLQGLGIGRRAVLLRHVDPRAPKLLEMPIEGVRPRGERAIVLKELPEGDQELPQVMDASDLGDELGGAGGVVDRGDRPVLKLHDRSFDHVAEGHRGRLPRVLELDLRAHRDEVPQDDHRRRIDGACGETGGPGPSVREPEASGTVRIGQDRTAPHRVGEVLRSPAALFIARLLLPQLGQELPSGEPQLLNDLPQLGRLLAEPFRDDEAGPATDPVGGDAREVPERAHLGIPFRRFARDTDGHVTHHGLDLAALRNVLEMLVVLVERISSLYRSTSASSGL